MKHINDIHPQVGDYVVIEPDVLEKKMKNPVRKPLKVTNKMYSLFTADGLFWQYGDIEKIVTLEKEPELFL